MLEQQKLSGKSNFTKIHVRMHFVPGDTIRALKPQRGQAAVEKSAAVKHDIQTLSQAVPC
jgi:hypothetical protein